jgi:hypothetical protein
LKEAEDAIALSKENFKLIEIDIAEKEAAALALLE